MWSFFIGALLAAEPAQLAVHPVGIVGVESYSELPSARYALADATAVGRRFGVEIVSDPAQGHAEAILGAVSDAAAQVPPDEVALFWYSGFSAIDGDGELRLLLADSSPTLDVDTRGGIALGDLLLAMAAHHGPNLVVLDTCAGGGSRGLGRWATQERAWSAPPLREGTALLLAAHPEAACGTCDGGRGSLFRQAFLRALEGAADLAPADGRVTVAEAASWVKAAGASQTAYYVGDPLDGKALSMAHIRGIPVPAHARIVPPIASAEVVEAANTIDGQLERAFVVAPKGFAKDPVWDEMDPVWSELRGSLAALWQEGSPAGALAYAVRTGDLLRAGAVMQCAENPAYDNTYTLHAAASWYRRAMTLGQEIGRSEDVVRAERELWALPTWRPGACSPLGPGDVVREAAADLRAVAQERRCVGFNEIELVISAAQYLTRMPQAQVGVDIAGYTATDGARGDRTRDALDLLALARIRLDAICPEPP